MPQPRWRYNLSVGSGKFCSGLVAKLASSSGPIGIVSKIAIPNFRSLIIILFFTSNLAIRVKKNFDKLCRIGGATPGLFPNLRNIGALAPALVNFAQAPDEVIWWGHVFGMVSMKGNSHTGMHELSNKKSRQNLVYSRFSPS